MSIQIGAPRPPAWLAAVFEGAGATLWWHAETGAPGAEIWDAARAAGWLHAVWPDADATVLSEASGEALGIGRTSEPNRSESGPSGADLRHNRIDPTQLSDRTGPLEPFARAAALAGWSGAWWPASHTPGIAPLDPRLIETERVLALAALDGASDDDDAVARAAAGLAARTGDHGPLDETDLGPRDAARLARLLPNDRQQPRAVLATVKDIAGDHGIDLTAAPAPTRTDYALAASGTAEAASLVSGTAPVDPGSVPQHVVDPFGLIEWRVTMTMTIEVTVAAAPLFANARPPGVDLRARIAGTEVPLARAGDVWFGAAAAPAGLIALPPARRTATLHAADFVPVEGVDPDALRRIADGL
ncbi:hypothetical protein [Microbacterium gubbeenense]|uniref:hypothetical protein n=1 Tax=Microbacterium gubbeenense TaxID=159896 RepID=UPI003F94F62F